MARSLHTYFVFVEGNIGVGKSQCVHTLTSELRRHFKGEVHAVPENVAQWTNVGGVNLLQLMYTDPQRYSGLFQRTVLTSRAADIDRIIDTVQSDAVLFVCERSMWSGRHVFVKALEQSGGMDAAEYASYTAYFDWHTKHVYNGTILGVIYLHDTVDACVRRIHQRARPEERNNIPVDYLKELDRRHTALLALPDAWRGAPQRHYNVAEYVPHCPATAPVEHVRRMWCGLATDACQFVLKQYQERG